MAVLWVPVTRGLGGPPYQCGHHGQLVAAKPVKSVQAHKDVSVSWVAAAHCGDVAAALCGEGVGLAAQSDVELDADRCSLQAAVLCAVEVAALPPVSLHLNLCICDTFQQFGKCIQRI